MIIAAVYRVIRFAGMAQCKCVTDAAGCLDFARRSAPYDRLLRVKGGYLYYSTASGGAFTWDVRDPQHPRGFTEYWTTYPPKQTYPMAAA